MPGELHDRLVKLAAIDERSLNGELVYLLRLAVWVQENLIRLPQADEPGR